jgi:sialate O-acetylesterase
MACAVLAGLACFAGQPARAAVKPHALIGEGMVLQQGMKAPVWGTADLDEKVTVRFQGREVSVTATNGRWQVELDDLKAGGPFEMTIAGTNTIELKNVYVGEVWVCSGQSNMEWPVRASADAPKVIAESKNPQIRLFTVPKRVATVPLHDVQPREQQGAWLECNPSTVPNFSAVAYFFGRDVQKARNVPVGLIHTSWGGTPAESWTSKAALEAEPSLRGMVANLQQTLTNYPEALDRYIERVQKYRDEFVKANAEGKNVPGAPRPPQDPTTNPWVPTGLYSGMIAPLLPYAVRGAIWYQGESNAGRAYQYRTLFPAMIKDWRAAWHQPEMPFLFVQLAPFTRIQPEPGESDWAELREAQLLATKTLPKVGMAVITDVGEEFDIHPKAKEPVGARLALAARALAYGERIEYSGPVYESMTVEGNKAILTFRHVGGGLVARDGPLVGFSVCGPDRKFVKAEAAIHDDKVGVWSPQVERPVAVRFGWANYPVVNLWNKDGMPATPFRTDDFPMVTGPKDTPAPKK